MRHGYPLPDVNPEFFNPRSNFNIELVKDKDIFKKNGYPISFIDRCIKTFLDKLHTPKINITTVEKKQLLTVLPYLGVVSDKIRSSLYKILSKNLLCCKLNIIFKASCRLSSYFAFKDCPCKDLISGIVYKFAILPILANLNAILKSELVNTWAFLLSLVKNHLLAHLLQQSGNTC